MIKKEIYPKTKRVSCSGELTEREAEFLERMLDNGR